MRVLLVDDNHGDVLLFREAMASAGVEWEVHAVHDGVQALQFLLRRPPFENAPRPDLVVMDLILPGKSGLEVMRECRLSSGCGDTPLVVMSGMSRQEIDCCAEWPPNRCLFLQKPMTFESYIEVVRNIETFVASIC